MTTGLTQNQSSRFGLNNVYALAQVSTGDLWVDASYAGPITSNGSRLAPFVTIQEAIDEIAEGSTRTVLIMEGSYAEDLVIGNISVRLLALGRVFLAPGGGATGAIDITHTGNQVCRVHIGTMYEAGTQSLASQLYHGFNIQGVVTIEDNSTSTTALSFANCVLASALDASGTTRSIELIAQGTKFSSVNGVNGGVDAGLQATFLENCTFTGAATFGYIWRADGCRFSDLTCSVASSTGIGSVLAMSGFSRCFFGSDVTFDSVPTSRQNIPFDNCEFFGANTLLLGGTAPALYYRAMISSSRFTDAWDLNGSVDDEVVIDGWSNYWFNLLLGTVTTLTRIMGNDLVV